MKLIVIPVYYKGQFEESFCEKNTVRPVYKGQFKESLSEIKSQTCI